MYHLQDEEVDYDYPHIHELMEKKDMTLCIAAICEDGNAAVMIADKMLTDETVGNCKLDNFCQKIDTVNDCYVLNAGDSQNAQKILTNAKKDISDKDSHLKIVDSYRQLRMELANDSIFKIRGLTNYDEYMQKQQTLNSVIVDKIDSELKKFNIKTKLMNVFYHKPSKEYKICVLENDLLYKDFSSRGFCSIGIEFHIVEFLIYKSGFTKQYNLEETKNLLITLKTDFEPYFDGIGKTHDYVCLRSGEVIESTI